MFYLKANMQVFRTFYVIFQRIGKTLGAEDLGKNLLSDSELRENRCCESRTLLSKARDFQFPRLLINVEHV